jgi:Mg-chelatase subunit ChlD
MNQPAIASKNVISIDQAKEYDHIILIDKSGSMGSPSDKMQGKSRWQEAQEFTEGYARFAEQVDEDGITVITFNSSPTVYDNVKAAKVTQIFTKEQPNGSTGLAKALDAAFKKKFSSGKKTIVLVLTDGSPDSQPDVVKSITDASNRIDRDEELAVQFIQIGSDPGAASFLQTLDDDLKGKFDIVNSLTREQAEAYTIEELLWQALND